MADVSWEQPQQSRRPPRLLLVLAGVTGAAVLAWAVATGDGASDLTVEPAPQPTPPAATEPPDGGREAAQDAEPDARATDEEPDAVAPARGPWRRLPHSPLVRRIGHSMTWTGAEIFVWGGSRPDPSQLFDGRIHLGSGAAFDPATSTWRRIAPAPIPNRDGHSAAWTGDELVVWGGRAAAPGGAGAAYRPGGGWRALPEGPLDDRAGRADARWTGDVLVAHVHEGDQLDVAVYDPAADAWSSGASLPVHAQAQVTAVTVGGKLVAMLQVADTARLYAYDPAVDAWHGVSDRVLPAATGVASAGHHVVSWGNRTGERFGQQWTLVTDVRTGAVRTFRAPPFRLGTDVVAEWTGARLVVWDGDRAAAFDVEAGTWQLLPEAPIPARAQPAGVWTGAELVVWGGGSDDRYRADGARLRPPPRAGISAGGMTTR